MPEDRARDGPTYSRARDMMRENKALTINLSKALAGKEGEEGAYR